MTWESVIGLEIHVQLGTESKIFSDCPSGFSTEPNNNIDPVCTGQPGVLPVLNEKAVDLAVKAALAVGCKLNMTSIFARKHYFYPDLPKAYQISQYDLPYAEHGQLSIRVGEQQKTIGITRIHMEEDAGKSSHGEGGDTYSYVDFNRAGAPLIEIVSEPDLRSAAEAGAYMRELHTIIRYVGVSDADMEKGNFRCDANVSVRKVGATELGTRTEIKNLNSFRFVEKAIEYEIERQIAVIEDGGQVVQQTRLWDTAKNRTFSMRDKEDAHDYRYFPDPDLPPLVLDTGRIEQLQSEIPELPAQKRARFVHELALKSDDAEILANDKDLADYFEAILANTKDAKLSANWVIHEVLGALQGHISDFRIGAERMAELLGLIVDGTISAKIGKDIFGQMLDGDERPADIVSKQGLAQISDTSEIEAMVQSVLDQYPDEVMRFKNGDQKLMGFFMGQIMKASQGKANPAEVQKIIRQKLS